MDKTKLDKAILHGNTEVIEEALADKEPMMIITFNAAMVEDLSIVFPDTVAFQEMFHKECIELYNRILLNRLMTAATGAIRDRNSQEAPMTRLGVLI